MVCGVWEGISSVEIYFSYFKLYLLTLNKFLLTEMYVYFQVNNF